MLRKSPPIVLFLISGLLLGSAWLNYGTYIIFIAWVPFFIALEKIEETELVTGRNWTNSLLPLLTFFVWNVTATWWLVNASWGGAVMAIVLNSIIMATVVGIYKRTKKALPQRLHLWFFVPVWLAFEYWHHQWEGSWPWLTIGNVFAMQHKAVQWYEFTGTSGGTLWALSVNLFVYNIYKNFLSFSQSDLKKKISSLSLLIFIPIVFSWFLHEYRLPTKSGKVSALIIQPNIDPYNAKFFYEPQIQLDSLALYLEGKLDSTIDYLILPETFLTEDIWENDLSKSPSIQFLKSKFISRYPNLTIVTGANTLYAYGKNENKSVTAREFSDSPNEYYDYFNTAFQIDRSDEIKIYHKSKLVPGVERLPYPWVFKPLESLAVDLGGTTGSLGVQENRVCFKNNFKEVSIAPIICYESIFGQYVTDYFEQNPNLMFIVTNDGWWGNTPAHKEHLAYGALRAIETRRQIARSANTGISCVIDEYGNINNPLPYWEKGFIKVELDLISEKTLYVRLGDVISKIAIVLFFLILILLVFRRFKKA